MPDRKCRVPACQRHLSAKNITGVCRYHTHSKPYCECDWCLGYAKEHFRVRTREELMQIPLNSTGRLPTVMLIIGG